VNESEDDLDHYADIQSQDSAIHQSIATSDRFSDSDSEDGYETAEEDSNSIHVQSEKVKTQLDDNLFINGFNKDRRVNPFNSGVSLPDESVIPITTRITSEHCVPFCRCQCHNQKYYRTPSWARILVGSFNFDGNCSVLMNRPRCNLRICKRNGQTSARFTYFAPSWVFGRAISFAASKQTLGMLNATIFITMPRVFETVNWPPLVMIHFGRVGHLKQLFANGLASIYDVNEMGTSLLLVCVRQINFTGALLMDFSVLLRRTLLTRHAFFSILELILRYLVLLGRKNC
jgi:hypothetical protein